MRLGISGLGVIAVVSFLVTAAPERVDSGSNNQGSSIDHSRTGGSERTSRTRYSWPSQVATETSNSGSSASSFVKIELKSRGSTSPEASRHLPHPSLVPLLHHTNQKAEIPTALASFTADFPVFDQAFLQPRNFKNAAIPPDVWSPNTSLPATLEDNRSLEVDPSVPISRSASSNIQENPVVSDPTLASFPSFRLPRGSRQTSLLSQRTEPQDNFDDKRSTTTVNEATIETSVELDVTRSESTMNQRLTTMTTRRRFPNEDFRNWTKRYEVKMSRSTRESARNKEPTDANDGQPHFHAKSSGKPISRKANSSLHSEAQRLTNYSANLRPTIHFQALHTENNDRLLKGHDETAPKRLMDNETTDTPAKSLQDKTTFVGKEMREVEVALSDDSLVHDNAMVAQQPLRVKSVADILGRKPETHAYSSVTPEIALAKQITSESTMEIPTIESPLLRFTGSMANTTDIDVATLFDNHKAMRVRSFQTVRSEQEQQQRSLSLGSSPFPSRLPYNLTVKGNGDVKDVLTGIGRPAMPVNQLTIPKSAYPVSKNLSKASINLVDGKPKKKYYEIKPSLITEMDHGINVEVTTTPRRSFDKFLLPSVPSAKGKFGPYFLDEEDRRNVTERIGNTVQLDCRIGMLGLCKVTWLQHYKDSFRLLTVERESYSVDRRISLNYQYPNNWRLQIAYASLRDSGLYKCQVEIDQDRSLVKRYNVIITAPILTITDDSGRAISGERHLKAGSALKLRCEARDIMQRLNESVLWMRGDETLTKDVSENRTTEIENEKEITIVVSTLLVEYAIPKHAGNYSCVVPEKARTTIAVHVLNGELPAAVQHGSGVSTAVLNVWLIHLTASYGFFR